MLRLSETLEAKRENHWFFPTPVYWMPYSRSGDIVVAKAKTKVWFWGCDSGIVLIIFPCDDDVVVILKIKSPCVFDTS